MRRSNAGFTVATAVAGIGLLLSGCGGSSKAADPTTTAASTSGRGTPSSTTPPTLAVAPSLCDVIPKQDVGSMVKAPILEVSKGGDSDCHYRFERDGRSIGLKVSTENMWATPEELKKLIGASKVVMVPDLGPDAYQENEKPDATSVWVRTSHRSLVVFLWTQNDAGDLDADERQTAVTVTKAFLAKLTG